MTALEMLAAYVARPPSDGLVDWERSQLNGRMEVVIAKNGGDSLRLDLEVYQAVESFKRSLASFGVALALVPLDQEPG